jgi:hypothetical protein
MKLYYKDNEIKWILSDDVQVDNTYDYDILVVPNDLVLTKTNEDGISVQLTVTEVQEALTNIDYASKRTLEYPTIQEQLDMQYWDSVNGTTTWQDAIEAIKNKYPKSE